MGEPFKHTMTANDRATFDKWLLGVSGIYAALAVLVISAIALGAVGHSDQPRASADITTASSSQAP
jgi:hypothetical protein